MVCDEVKFSVNRADGMSQSILLPWAPGVYQEVELKATGGWQLSTCSIFFFKLFTA